MNTQKPISQQGRRHEVDIAVIGAGIAGLNYILDVVKHHPKVNIALIIKKELIESNSYYAQGGIAAATESYDSIEAHINDTIKAGDGLCHASAVKTIIENGKSAIDQLIQQGVEFSKNEKGFSLAQEGGHSSRRIYNAGDFTGKAIINALIKKVKSLRQVTCYEDHTAVQLISQAEQHTPGYSTEVTGVYVLDEKRGKIDTYLANLVVLASGGAGKVFRYTTNPETATGDGIAMAYRAGARIGNMEFYQFHPTLLYHHKINNFLISEAVRGEGAYLLTADTKERFMKRYDPEKMELATRDIVARAIFTEIEKSEHSFVYLDIRHVDRDFLKNRFPTIFATLLELGIDMSKDLIPVVPAAHYLCGGVLTNVNGMTDLKRLYAIGETAFTGLHGANRLASNSLLEGIVMAQLAAKDSLTHLNIPVDRHEPTKDWDSKHVTDLRRASQINALWRGLRGEMTSFAGIVRTEAGLSDLQTLINTRRVMIENYYQKHTITRDVIELYNIILIAKLIVRSALKRQETRGGHYREDFPKKHSSSNDIILRANEASFSYIDET